MINAQLLWRLRQRGSALSGLHPEQFATPELATIAAEFAAHYAAMAALDEKIAELARLEGPTSADQPIPNPAERIADIDMQITNVLRGTMCSDTLRDLLAKRKELA